MTAGREYSPPGWTTMSGRHWDAAILWRIIRLSITCHRSSTGCSIGSTRNSTQRSRLRNAISLCWVWPRRKPVRRYRSSFSSSWMVLNSCGIRTRPHTGTTSPAASALNRPRSYAPPISGTAWSTTEIRTGCSPCRPVTIRICISVKR